MDQRLSTDAVDYRNGDYTKIKDEENPQLGMFDKPLPLFGCGIGWFLLLLGFACPLMWYYAAILYFRRYYHKDPRERDGLVANAVAKPATNTHAQMAFICTVAAVITAAVILLLKLCF